jgi:myo-inositol-1(or 4)-monophosphatase
VSPIEADPSLDDPSATPEKLMSDARDFEAVATEAAKTAGDLLRRRFREKGPLNVETKGLHDFVTAVDREAEGLLYEFIGKHCPGHAIMSEEGSPDAESAEHRWVVDPLDGTTNFIHGVPTFAVSVALENREGLVAGAIYDPMRDEVFHAHRGGGARLNGETIRCSRPDDMHVALLATGFPFRELSRLGQYLEAFEAFVHATAGMRRAGSAALDLAYTACGRYDGFWEIGLSRWDLAAGVLIVREAGGTVTDVVGNDTTLDTGDVLAAYGEFHSTLLGITRVAFS